MSANPYEMLLGERPVDTNPYDKLLDEQKNSQRQALRQSMLGAANTNPDQYAKAVKLGRETGVPAPIAHRNPDMVKRAAASNQYDQLLNKSPQLAKFLATKPNAAKVSHDDTGVLGGIEHATKAAFGQAVAPALKSLYGMANDVYGNVLGLASVPLIGYDKAKSAITGAPSTSAEDWWFKNEVQPRFEVEHQMQLGKNASMAQRVSYGLGQGLGLFALTALTGPEAMSEDAAQAGDGALNYLRDLVEHSFKAMAVPATSSAMDTARQVEAHGGTGGEALNAALASYLANSLAGTAPIGAEGKVLKRTVTGAMAGLMTAQMMREGQNLALPKDMRQPFSLKDSIASALQFGLMGAAFGPRPFIDSVKAMHDAEHLQKVFGLARESATRKRDTQTFGDFMQGLPNEDEPAHVYVRAGDLRDAADQAGVNPETLSPIVKAQMENALKTDGDLELPLSDVAQWLPGSSLEQSLIPHLKTDPEGMSQMQAHEFLQGAAQDIAAAADTAKEQHAPRAEFRRSAKAVDDTIKQRLNDAGQFSPDVNKTYASLMSSMYTTMADRLGTTPEELFNRYPMRITGENGAGTFEQPGGEDHRGSIELNNIKHGAVIHLSKHADLSTFVHESGHFWLEVMNDIARGDGAPDGVHSDMGTLLKWFGVKGDTADERLAHWNGLSTDEKRTAHEQFARGMEHYLMEGKAPSVELGDVFARVKAWMMHIYRHLANLNVPMTDEVRGVFDRLMASDDAIAEAEAAQGYFDMPKPEGVSDSEWNAYRNLGTKATHEAMRELQSRSLRDLQWLGNAKNKLLGELQRKAKRLRAGVREKAAAEVDQMPVYKAERFLKHGVMETPEGEHIQVPSGHRLNLGDVRELYGEGDVAKSDPNTVDPTMDDLLSAVAKLGGLKREDASAEGIDPAHWAQRRNVPVFGKPVFRASGGESFDAMAEALHQRGYLSEATPNALLDALDKSLRGDPQYSGHVDYDKVYGAREADQANAPDWRKLRTGKNGLLSPDGLDPQLAAEWFGYDSADAMIRDLVSRQPRADAVEAVADRLMLEEHGEYSSPEDIARQADLLIHNDARARMMATGLKMLSKSPTPVRILARAATDVAQRMVGDTRVKDLKPRQYTAAEARANRELLQKAPKDPEGAVQAQRAALLNNRLARAAMDAQTDVEKGLVYLKKFTKKTIRAKLDPDVLEQIDDLLSRFELRKKPPDEEPAQRMLRDWLEAQKALGYAPLENADMMNPAFRTRYNDMTVDQFRALRDTVKSMEHIARQRRKISIEGRQMEIADAVGEMTAKMAERGEKFTDAQLAEPPRRGVDPIWRVTLDRLQSALRWAGADLRPQHFKANQFDLHEILGPFHRYIFEPIFSANYRYMEMRGDISKIFAQGAKKLGAPWQKSLGDVVENHNLIDASLEPLSAEALQQAHPKRYRELAKELRKLNGRAPTPDEVAARYVKRRLTRADLIGMALHVGNESNFDKLTKGMGWDGAAVMRTLDDNMRREDWEAVKLLWHVANMHWPKMVAMNKRMGNTMPEKIEARPFMTRFGEMPGGYAPVRYDPIRSRFAARKADAQAVNPAEGLFAKDYYRADTTTNGSLNARVAGYHDFVNLDWHATERAIHDGIRDLAYREALVSTHKLLVDRDFRQQFMRTYGREQHDALLRWLGQLVNGDVSDERTDKWVALQRRSRRAIVANGIAFRLSTMAKHGGSAAIKSAGYFLGSDGKRYLLARARQIGLNHGAAVEEGLAKSHELRARYDMQNRDFSRPMATLMEGASLHERAERFGHAGVAYLDFLTAVPTFLAAHDLAINKGVPKRLGGTGKPMSDTDAAKWADSVVREAHGTYIESGRSNIINTRSEWVRNLTILYTFMDNTLGQTMDAYDKALHSDISKPLLAARFMAVVIAPALIAGTVTEGGLNGKPWWEWAAGALGGEFSGMVPMVRTAYAVAVEGWENDALPPWMSAFESLAKPIHDVSTGHRVKHPIKDIGNAAGLFIPGLGQAGATTQFLLDTGTGKQHPQTLEEWLRGLSKGHAKPAN